MRSTKTPANLNGSARPDGNPKPITQDQSPKRGCGSYSHCAAPVRRNFVFSEWFSPFPQTPHTGQRGACFLGWYHTQFSAFIFVQNMLEISLTSPLVYGNIHHAERQKQRKPEEKTMWTEGTIQVGTSTFHYWVKHYEEPSIFGYEEGRASKISLRRNGKTVFNFDRGMDIPPEDEETETALAILLKQYN